MLPKVPAPRPLQWSPRRRVAAQRCGCKGESSLRHRMTGQGFLQRRNKGIHIFFRRPMIHLDARGEPDRLETRQVAKRISENPGKSWNIPRCKNETSFSVRHEILLSTHFIADDNETAAQHRFV